MKFIIKILAHISINALAVYAAAYFIDGIKIQGDVWSLFAIGAILGIINALIRPIIKILAFPLIVLTFGLFMIIINTACLLLASFLIPAFSIENFSSAVLGVIIISLVNYILSFFIKE